MSGGWKYQEVGVVYDGGLCSCVGQGQALKYRERFFIYSILKHQKIISDSIEKLSFFCP